MVKIYPYRWVVLGTFMLINVMVQVLWICYAPIASIAATAYGVSRDHIDLLAYLFMLIYLPVAFPAAWAIDSFGFKKAVGFGALAIGVFGLLRALFPDNYTVALLGTIGISIGQPFLLTAFTKLAALWFPKNHRATVTGIIFLSMFVGIGLGEALGPVLVTSVGFSGLLLIYGIATAVSVALFLVFARSNPPTPASPPGEETRALVLDGLKKILKTREVYIFCAILFIGSALVNGIFTLIDGFGREKGLSVDQGVILTVILLAGGIVGSVILPAISDGLRRRKAVLIVGFFLAVPAILCLALGRDFIFEMIAFFVTGFCITGLCPVLYQYGAELTHPAPEGTSNGIFALIVQASGFVILLMDALKSVFSSYVPSLIGLGILMGVSGAFLFLARESPEVRRQAAEPEAETE